MLKISSKLNLFLNLTRVQAELNRRLDASLNGLSLSEFIILYHLSQIKDQKLRRIDLAEKISMSSSGVTRMLLPMEKRPLWPKQSTYQGV